MAQLSNIAGTARILAAFSLLAITGFAAFRCRFVPLPQEPEQTGTCNLIELEEVSGILFRVPVDSLVLR